MTHPLHGCSGRSLWAFWQGDYSIALRVKIRKKIILFRSFRAKWIWLWFFSAILRSGDFLGDGPWRLLIYLLPTPDKIHTCLICSLWPKKCANNECHNCLTDTQTHISEKSHICMILKPFKITIHVVQHYTSPALMKPRTLPCGVGPRWWGDGLRDLKACKMTIEVSSYQTMRLSQVTTSSPPKGIIPVMLLGWLRQLACWTQHQRRSTHKVNPPAN